MGSSESKIFAVLAHVSFFFLPFLLPLILMFVKKDDPFVYHHAKQALAFHLLLGIALVISYILFIVFIGMILVPACGIIGLLFTISATIRTLNGEYYRYPVSGNWF